LVDSEPLRAALSDYPTADLAVAISASVYAMVIRPGYPGIPASQFNRVNVVAKEFTGPAWIWVSARQWSQPAYQRLLPDDPREIGGYRLAARLGDGPAGRVYLGHHLGASAGGWLAVKAFYRELAADKDVRRRLVAGALAAGVVRGPHIARSFDADTESGRPWVASQLVQGPSLAAAVAETGPLPAESVTWLTRDVAQSLVALHNAGVAHQAIVPGNVLLEPGGPVLTDLALSGVALTAGAVSPADDVFLLGCCAYFAASGHTPWGDCPIAVVLTGAVAGDPDLADCPPELLPVVSACLERDPGRRPAAAELLTQLDRVAGQQPRSWLPYPVAARCAEYRLLPPSPPAHLARLRSRRRGDATRGP
jgi:serine/threonine protein kinase